MPTAFTLTQEYSTLASDRVPWVRMTVHEPVVVADCAAVPAPALSTLMHLAQVDINPSIPIPRVSRAEQPSSKPLPHLRKSAEGGAEATPGSASPALTRTLTPVVGTYAYQKWRPRIHLMPSHGWINDPCAPGYDPASGTYHLAFQWNPDDTEWGNISWGNALSKDLVSWTTSETPILRPSTPYDCAGVFSGCMWPSGVDGSAGRGALTCAYTAVKHLPIHYTRPYLRGCETVALAVSSDAGRTWTRFGRNPVVAEPPPGLDITGWRDPYIAPWPAVAEMLRSAGNEATRGVERHRESRSTPLYGLLSGGIRGETPTTFLYEIDGNGPHKWRYLGLLVQPGLNFSPSPRWAGDFGANWEVCNFLSLSDSASGASRHFLICGVEGRIATAERLESQGEFRATHAQMWMGGALEPRDGCVEMKYRSGGVLDHGAYYAGNSFWDPQTRQHVIFGWVLEEDLSPELRRQQGWAGALTLPRVVKLLVLRSVVRALVSSLESIACVEFVPEKSTGATYTAYTLSAVPDPRLGKLRDNERKLTIQRHSESQTLRFPRDIPTWEAKLSFSFGSNARSAGLRILHGQGELSVFPALYRPELSCSQRPQTKEQTSTSTAPRRPS